MTIIFAKKLYQSEAPELICNKYKEQMGYLLPDNKEKRNLLKRLMTEDDSVLTPDALDDMLEIVNHQSGIYRAMLAHIKMKDLLGGTQKVSTLDNSADSVCK